MRNIGVVLLLAIPCCVPPNTLQYGDPPLVHPNQAGQIWSTRSIRYVDPADDARREPVVREASGLFACYPAPADKPGAPACYLAKYVKADGTEVVFDDVRFPHPQAPAAKP